MYSVQLAKHETEREIQTISEDEEDITKMESRGKYVYNLKLDMLLTVLSANRHTCELRAEVTATALSMARKAKGLSGNSEASTIELSIIQGRIRSCAILGQDGHIQFKGQAALELCALCGELAWIVRLDKPADVALTLYTSRSDHSDQDTHSASAQFRVMRHLEFTSEQLNTLPRKDRQVWMILGNGPREVKELCQMLHLSYEQLIPILNKLAAMQVVRYMRDE